QLPGAVAYTVTASVPDPDDVPGGVTINRLRAAGTNYPPDILARYLTVPDGAMGTNANNLLKEVQTKAKGIADAQGRQLTPYASADTIVHTLQSSPFEYKTNIISVCKPDQGDTSIVECFADHHQGFCEYYASTMAILLRKANIPARLVEGFLPGA